MTTMTKTYAQIAHEFIGAIDAPGFCVFAPNATGNWGASCYWPKGDVIRDTGCHGRGYTLEAAIADMWAKVEKAKEQQKVLKTAAECKEAVLNLIREHDAAPASFRDAVDALPVKG
ncbi:hypothetical protein [Rhizorhapis suberifaciens]|uniref:Uncharacterized protein n=1 Tax=Rhizorhapis suberifaciens TaxID=13656 RepID=A0A840HY20_9SPHN|nr:hypothetical protein [Rhizorhapis suberifaciens]MBB4642336.1 hypothetical protein [Rhizorhapis suberifaciens]